MTEECDKNVVLAESEKKSQKKKTIIIWAIAAILLLATIIITTVDYAGYKKGQKYGIKLAMEVSEETGYKWINSDDSYKKQCKDLYYKLNKHTSDYYIYGKKIDASSVRESENALRSAFYNVMKSNGYTRYGEYSIANWFKYTDPISYYFATYWDFYNNAFDFYDLKIDVHMACVIVIVLAIAFSIFAKIEEKKKLIVYDNSVLCMFNSHKSRQITFDNISFVDIGKNSLKLVGVGLKFKILNLTNAEEIRKVIMDKKNAI